MPAYNTLFVNILSPDSIFKRNFGWFNLVQEFGHARGNIAEHIGVPKPEKFWK